MPPIQWHRPILASLLITLVYGCAPITREPELDLERLDAPETTLPYTAGIYYSPEFRNYEHVRYYGSSSGTAVPLGQSSVKLFDAIFPKIFASVIEIPRLGPDLAYGSQVDFVIEPSVEAFDFQTVIFEPDSPEFRVQYRFNLYSADAIPIGSWVITGDLGLPGEKDAVEHVGINMRLAAEELLAYFESASSDESSEFELMLDKIDNLELVSGPPADRMRINVIPVTDPDSQQELFGGSIEDTGIIILQVRITEAAHLNTEIQPWAARLLLPNGRLVPPASPSEVLSILDTPEHAASLFVGVPLLFFVDAAVEGKKTTRRAALRRELDALQIQPGYLSNPESREGLLYFVPKLTEQDTGLENARLRLWLSDETGVAYVTEQPVDVDLAKIPQAATNKPSNETERVPASTGPRGSMSYEECKAKYGHNADYMCVDGGSTDTRGQLSNEECRAKYGHNADYMCID